MTTGCTEGLTELLGSVVSAQSPETGLVSRVLATIVNTAAVPHDV